MFLLENEGACLQISTRMKVAVFVVRFASLERQFPMSTFGLDKGRTATRLAVMIGSDYFETGTQTAKNFKRGRGRGKHLNRSSLCPRLGRGRDVVVRL